MHRISKLRYRSIRHIKSNKKLITSEKMAHALMPNRSRDLWSEVKRVKGRTVRYQVILMVLVTVEK